MVAASSGIAGSLPIQWRAAPRRWGHDLHSLCSYMAMFPPSMPSTFIRWLTDPGEVVYDPFSGRGTTAFEACLLGRAGRASDANPLAWLLTAAKVDPPSRRAVRRRITILRKHIEPLSIREEPAHIKMLFRRSTLGQLLWLRQELSVERKVDRFLLAALSGILHRNADKYGRPRGLTVAMPNTFAMSPGYVKRYIADKGLKAPKVNVLDALEERVEAMELPSPGFVRGRAWMQEATQSMAPHMHGDRAKLIFSSPPYLEVILYGKYNWLRLWLLGEERKAVDQTLFTSSSLTKYLQFMKTAVGRAAAVLRDDGFICLVIGDVRKRSTGKEILLGEEVAANCCPEGLKLIGVVPDALPVEHKVSRIWADNRGRATRTDRIVIFGGPKATVRATPEIQWS